MNDLLHLVRDAPSGNSSGAAGGSRDLEMGYTPAPTHVGGNDADAELAAFFARAKEVQAGMQAVHDKQRELLIMHEQGKAIVRMRDVTEHRAKMQVRRSWWLRCMRCRAPAAPSALAQAAFGWPTASTHPCAGCRE